jgi:hypothetical protein
MTRSLITVLAGIHVAFVCAGQESGRSTMADSKKPEITQHSRGLHGYIGYGVTKPPEDSHFNMGMGFYTAAWTLVDKPIANFQIGLPGCWILPDNSDNKDKPLAPEGTRARQWKERGPTWSSVFQTVECGLGYWRGNRFRYGPPKFSMNATPQCYDYEVASPGWSFFYDTKALPDDRLGVAQLSNRLLIPPDALPFEGTPDGEFMGYTYMALPFTDPVNGEPPTGDHAWTCFLNTANFKGPIAYYVPETWSKIAKLFDYPFIYGRGLDSRPGTMGGGAMEINTVPCFEGTSAKGETYSKIPQLKFPVDKDGRTILVQQVTYYSKSALYDDFLAWRKGGRDCSGVFNAQGAWRPALKANKTRYSQADIPIAGLDGILESHVYPDNMWGIQWSTNGLSNKGAFPQYFRHEGNKRVPVASADVPEEMELSKREFRLAKRGDPFTSPSQGAWVKPGPAKGPYTVKLIDGSLVTYYWYRFVDQPTFQQYQWSEEKKKALQDFVEKIHASWPIDRDYMAPPTTGSLVKLDPALIVQPPPGLGTGYVPIVTKQEDALQSNPKPPSNQ